MTGLSNYCGILSKVLFCWYQFEAVPVTFQSGSIIGLRSKPDALYQVVNLDEVSGSAWVRRWPLSRHRFPTFSVPHAEITAADQGSLR